MHADLSKEELAEKMREKAQMELASGGPGSVIVHNLENFAYRFMETSSKKEIKCMVGQGDYKVEAIETDILEALKWKNSIVKEKLISLCRDNPGSSSKKIQIKLTLGCNLISENKIKCIATLNWDFPNFESIDKQFSNENTNSFEDLYELRNKHAIWLEEITDLFL